MVFINVLNAERLKTVKMLTNFNKIDCDWTNAKNKCRTTVNKEHTEVAPSSTFKQKLLLSEHSPIRVLTFDWIWKNMKSWVATHWVRHIWSSFVSTQRTDRTGVNRDELPQGALVSFEGSANAQNLIDTWRKRLCYCASKETREFAEDFKIVLRETEPEISNVLVPNCVYRCGCPEFEPCGYWDAFKGKYGVKDNLQERYDDYNRFFYKEDVDA